MTVRRGRGLAFASLPLLVLLLFAGSAQAKTIQVRPKKADAVQKAVDKAKAGDTLVIHEGRYPGAVHIETNRLTLKRAKGEKRPVLDGQCDVQRTIEIRAERIALDGLSVRGAAEGFGSFPSQVDYEGTDRGSVNDLVLRNSCHSAEYGVNVFDGGHITITNSNSKGFTDAGIYVGNINDTSAGPLIIEGNDMSGNTRGVIVEDAHPHSDDPGKPVDVRVIGNDLHDNTLDGLGPPTGLFLFQSDNVLIRNNTTDDNGVYGIHLDGGSDNARLIGNKSNGNETSNFFNEGQNSCGSGNSFKIPVC